MIEIPKPFPHQLEDINKLRSLYKQGFRCPLLVASTGYGKTFVLSYITHGAMLNSNPVVIIAHRKEIIKQLSMSLAKFGVKHQVIADLGKVADIKVSQVRKYGTCFVDKTANIIVGSVQTLHNRLSSVDRIVERSKEKNPKSKLICIVDEAHHCVGGTYWGKIMSHCFDNHHSLGLKVTATPERLDGRGLGAKHNGYADCMVEAKPMKWLIENKFLSPYRIWTVPNQIDIQGLHKRMGDFISSELEERVNKPTITGDAIKLWKDHAQGMKTIIFCVSVDHSKEVAKQFNEAGIRTQHIDGTTESKERDQAIIDFADGKLDCLTQVNLFSEGFDLSSIVGRDVTIGCMLDLAPTNSLVNYMQRNGRALRYEEGKVAVLLDPAGNTERHGSPAMPREWSLEGYLDKKKSKATDVEKVLVRTCPKCFAIHDPAPTCPECGHIYEVKARKIRHEDGELIELTEEMEKALMERKAKKKEQGRAQTLDELKAIEAARGFKSGWAEHVFKARQAKLKV